MKARKVAECRGCGAPIEFIELDSGKYMPVDEKPVKVIYQGAVVSARWPHWASCRKADKFRKKRAQKVLDFESRKKPGD